MKIDVSDFLSQFKGNSVSYVPNPGNAGDAIIAAATYQLFDRISLSYRVANREMESYTGETIVYGGGGNLGNMKTFSARFLARAHKTAKRVVILPHTIKDVTPLLKDFGSNVDIICRELVTYQYVKSIAPAANVYIANDMALSLDVKSLLLRRPTIGQKASILFDYARCKFIPMRYGQPQSIRSARRIVFANQLIQQMRANRHDVLYAYRTDAEKTEIQLPSENIDVSEALTMGVESKELAYINAHYFLEFLNGFAKIHTNRLHVCIGSALLGKAVAFHGNDYYKCRAVYEYSLTDFPNVVFHNDGG
jgi:exopolysaccharide biosynthesis predicted pyruvyltransferase EpsI